eukprot:2258709-Amphidinium_carterae.1
MPMHLAMFTSSLRCLLQALNAPGIKKRALSLSSSTLRYMLGQLGSILKFVPLAHVRAVAIHEHPPTLDNDDWVEHFSETTTKA